MNVMVILQPSGRRFRVEHGETVLEAALRSGIALNYKCVNGTCGECRARIVAGELAHVAPHDYVLRETEKQQGVALMCRSRPASDLVIEAMVARSPDDIPRQTIVTRVERIEDVSPQVRLLELRTSRSQTLRFLAGQSVTLQLAGFTPSTFSIGSCPCNGMFLQFHLRRDDGDPFLHHLFHRLQLRDSITVSGPSGRFVLDEESTRPLIFLAHGTGFAPVKSLIEQAFNLELPQQMTLYWTSRNPHGPYLANYCHAWEDAFDNFRYVSLGERGGYTSTPELLEQAVNRICHDHPQLKDCDFYASVNNSQFRKVRQQLFDAGLPAQRLFENTPN